jgi:hypothetical protein
LQSILAEEKECLESTAVTILQIDNYSGHYAVKNVWPLVSGNLLLQRYMPTEEM